MSLEIKVIPNSKKYKPHTFIVDERLATTIFFKNKTGEYLPGFHVRGKKIGGDIEFIDPSIEHTHPIIHLPSFDGPEQLLRRITIPLPTKKSK